MGEFNEAWRTVKANETSEGARTLVRAARPACLGNGGHGGFREWYPPWSPCFSVCSVRGLLLGSGEKNEEKGALHPFNGFCWQTGNFLYYFYRQPFS